MKGVLKDQSGNILRQKKPTLQYGQAAENYFPLTCVTRETYPLKTTQPHHINDQLQTTLQSDKAGIVTLSSN